MSRLKRSVGAVLCAAVGLASLSGCESKSGNGTLIGGGIGAGSGAVIGSQVAGRGARTEGALIGAGVGALVGGGTGYLLGREGDKEDARRRRDADRDLYYQQPPAAPAQPAYPQPGYGQPATPPPLPPAPPPGNYQAPPAQPMQALTPQDVILWSQRGTPENVIIDRIQRSGTRFYLSPQDEQQLRAAGVSANVVAAMRATAGR